MHEQESFNWINLIPGVEHLPNHVVHAALPILRAQGSGHIIQISTIGGVVCISALCTSQVGPEDCWFRFSRNTKGPPIARASAIRRCQLGWWRRI